MYTHEQYWMCDRPLACWVRRWCPRRRPTSPTSCADVEIAHGGCATVANLLVLFSTHDGRLCVQLLVGRRIKADIYIGGREEVGCELELCSCAARARATSGRP